MSRQEQYVTFETAKLLKEKGFDWELRTYYNEDGDELTLRDDFADMSNSEIDTCDPDYIDYLDIYCTRPTQQMSCSWLRDKEIDILPDCSLVDRKYSFHIINRYKTGGEIIHSDDMYDKYENAIEAALEFALKNLI